MGQHTSPTCPVVDESGPLIQPIVGSLNFHQVSIIISGATAVWSCLIALWLVLRHATHFSNPAEQKQIIRIINIIPAFALINLLYAWLDGSPAPYITPALDVAEAFPLAAFFLLMSAYLVPDEGDREAFFAQLELIDKRGNSTGAGSLLWYKRLSLLVIQFIPASIILWIVTAITLGSNVYCATSNKPHFAHIWITLLRMASTAVCVVAILRFYKRSKSDLKPRGTFKQLLCFKIIVLLNFLQTFIFNFLTSGGHLHATKYLRFQDLSHGIPSLILSCEIALIAPLFFIAYSPARYIIRNATEEGRRPQDYAGGPFGIYAILSAINIIDIVTALVQAINGRGGGSEFALPQQAPPAYIGETQGFGGRGGRRERRQRRSGRY